MSAPVQTATRTDRFRLTTVRPRTLFLVMGMLTPITFTAWQLREARQWATATGDPTALRFKVCFLIVPYLLIVGTGAIAAASGCRRLALLPPIAYAVIGATNVPTVSNGVLGAWPTDVSNARLASLVLAVVPCAAASLVAPARVQSVRTTVETVFSLVTVSGTIAMAVAVRAALQGWSISTNLDLVVVAGISGLAASYRPQLIPLAIAFAAPLSPDILASIASGQWSPVVNQEATFFAAVVLVAASHRTLARALRLLTERKTRLIVAVNLLNVIDAVATVVALRSGRATEANPFVGVIGFPIKVAVGLVASILIARQRPTALLVPLVFLTWVTTWHLLGNAIF